jgi:hypothetical protein
LCCFGDGDEKGGDSLESSAHGDPKDMGHRKESVAITVATTATAAAGTAAGSLVLASLGFFFGFAADFLSLANVRTMQRDLI